MTTGVMDRILGKLKPAVLLLTSGKWYIDGVAVTATASQLNSGGGGGSLAVTDGTHTVSPATTVSFSGATVTDAGGGTATVAVSAGSSVNLTASGALAAGTAVAVNASGNAVQTFSAAPNVAGTATVIAAPTGGGQFGSPSVLALDASHFLVVGPDISGVPSLPWAVAVPLSVSGATVTVGTANTDASFQTLQSAAALDATHFVYAYTDPGNSNLLTLRVGSISGGVVTLGTAQATAGTATPSPQPLAALSATKFVLVYMLSGQANFVVGTVSGTTITLGSPGAGTLPAGSIGLAVVGLSASEAAMAYVDAGTSRTAIAACTVSGTTLTEGTPALIASTAPANSVVNVAVVDSTHVCVAWQEISGATGYQGFAAVASVSGTTATWGGVATVSDAASVAPFVSVLSASELAFVAGYTGPALASLSGATLTVTLGTPLPVPYVGGTPLSLSNNTFPLYPPMAALDASHLMWVDGSWNLYEQDTSGNVSPPIAHQGLYSYALFPVDSTRVLTVFTDYAGSVKARVIAYNAITPSGPVGFTASSVVNGGIATVVSSGVIGGFSGLTVGARYYVNGDGTLTTANTGYPAGVATSATQILVQ